MTIDILIKTLIFLCSICLLGFLVNSFVKYICRNKNKSKISLCSLPLFFILGGGVYAFYEMFFSISGIKSNIAHFILLFAILFLFNIIFYFRDKKTGLKPDVSYAKVKKVILPAIIILVISIPLVINLIMAMAFPQFEIDMMGHILFKAKLFTTETYRSSIFVHDNIFESMQSRYPPFVAMFFNLLFLFGGNTVSCYQIVNYFILFLLGLSAYVYLRNNDIPLWLCLVSFFVFIYTLEFSLQYIIDTNDILLSLSFLLTVIWLIEFQKRQDEYSLVICSTLVGISTLIKKEALVFSVIVVFVLFWLNRKALFIYLLIWSAIAIPWLIYRRTIPEYCNTPEVLIKTVNILKISGQTKYAFNAIFPFLIKWWNSVFVLWVLSLVILLKSRYKKECVIFSIISFILFFVYFMVISFIIDRAVKCEIGFRRILSHIYPMVFICVVLAIKELIYKDDREYSK